MCRCIVVTMNIFINLSIRTYLPSAGSNKLCATAQPLEFGGTPKLRQPVHIIDQCEEHTTKVCHR